MSEIKLKNCPFCGGEAEMGFRDASAFVMCTKCLARSRTVVACVDYTAREVAADEWNQRTDQPPKAAGHEKMSRVTTVKRSRMGLLSVVDAKKRFLCRQIRLITARTAEQEWT